MPIGCEPISSSLVITSQDIGQYYANAEAGDQVAQNNQVITWGCNSPLNIIPVAAPSFAMAGSIPASITIPSPAPFSTSYGMPILYLYSGTNGTPSLAATVTASSVVSGGGSAVFPLPSSLAASSYGLVTANATSSGTYQPNGVNFFAVGSSQSQAGAPFGVAASGLTDSQTYCKQYPHGQENCTTTTTYSAVPVVTLYSQNQVLIGGRTAINVGPNPTAVATYNGGQVTTSLDNGLLTNTYTGTTRAVAANSGSNTISIIDTVNNDVISNVTVGNQPVALAVSSNGTTAYAVNYTDGTVTQVNLSTETPITTIAVGGQPTSVALAANGTLWVGGAGFLTEINTQNMTVTATETTSKTIMSLGYSDQVSQIVAVTADSSGNVYDDQLNPANVTAGGTYTPANSVVVSSLGTHLDVNTNEDVRAFTATLPSTLVPPALNLNQPGGPPLVVYDAWVAITATPTGFTITDIADNYVFDSVSTPSPVTAIAVDANLNVAYLTMPDSNLVWTVPLPGLGN
jgi:YVTN family beta-propeller protein